MEVADGTSVAEYQRNSSHGPESGRRALRSVSTSEISVQIVSSPVIVLHDPAALEAYEGSAFRPNPECVLSFVAFRTFICIDFFSALC